MNEVQIRKGWFQESGYGRVCIIRSKATYIHMIVDSDTNAYVITVYAVTNHLSYRMLRTFVERNHKHIKSSSPFFSPDSYIDY